MLVYAVYAYMPYEYNDLLDVYDEFEAAVAHSAWAKANRPNRGYEDILIDTIEVKSAFSMGDSNEKD